MHLLHSFTSLYRVPIAMHSSSHVEQQTTPWPGGKHALGWGGEDIAPGGRMCGGCGLETGGAATRTAVPMVPSPTECSPTLMSSCNHLTGAASLYQWETTGQSSANNASLALEVKCSIWHLTCCILNICSWICLSSRKR